MEKDGRPFAPRKRKFVPKGPPRRPPPKPTTPEPSEADNQEEQEEEKPPRRPSRLDRFIENVSRKGSKVEKKPPAQVALQPGTSSTGISSFGIPKDDKGATGCSSDPKGSSSDNVLATIPSAALKEDEEDTHPLEDDNALAPSAEKKYGEPWDDCNSYYPTVLPLRKPFSGDPDLLDENEFGEAARHRECNKNTSNAAADLGLTEERGERKMFLFQLPGKLPLVNPATSTKGKEKIDSSKPAGYTKKENPFEGLSGGYMGKMLVFKSGAIKLKLGEILYDVSPGSNCMSPEDAVVINTKQKNCCAVGSLNKHVMVTPDIDSVLDSVLDLGSGK